MSNTENDLLELNHEQFEYMRKLIYKNFGIHIQDNKKVMLKSKLSSLIKSNKEYNVDNIFHKKSFEHPASIRLLADKISTNHTFFFRETDHFHILQEFLENKSFLKSKSEKKLRVWSAGCSSGQEPYTIAMIIDNILNPHFSGIDSKILATDISLTALSEACRCVYTEQQIEKVPKNFVKKYFEKIDEYLYKIKPKITKDISIKYFNLMQKFYPFKGKFDFIFCRNVMIYFNSESTELLINKFYDVLENNGVLFIGQTESMSKKLREKFKFLAPGVFQKKGK